MAEGNQAPGMGNVPPVVDQQGAIEATGCASLNEHVLLCYDAHRDWRACKPEMEAFRECYRRFQQTKTQLDTLGARHSLGRPPK